jgi:hypothetical protein
VDVADSGRRIAILIAVGVCVLGVAVALSVQGRTPAPTGGPGPTAVPSRPSGGVDPSLAVAGYKDFSVLPGAPAEPIGKSLQSRLWEVDGRWWAVLVEPRTRATHIYALNAERSAWSDTGVVVDERVGAVADAIWAGGHLYVATTVPGRATANGPRLTRFSRTPAGGFRADANFPVRISDGGVAAISITRDSSGRVWAAFVKEGQVMTAHSADDDAVWTAPTKLATQGDAVGEDDLAALVALDSSQVGIVWTRAAGQIVRFAVRHDADPPDAWSAAETVVDGMPLSANAISVKAAPRGRVVATVETAVADTSGAPPAAVESVAVVRDSDGTWRAALLSRVQDRLGPPVVVVDAAGTTIHVFATSPRRGGAIYLKSADLDRLEFPAGKGAVVVSDASNPGIADPTSTAQLVNTDDGLVVLGFDRDAGTYWHGVVRTAATAGSSPSLGPTPRSSEPPVPSVPPTIAYIRDNFDPWPVNQPIGNGWELRADDPPGALRAAADGAGDGHHAVLTTLNVAPVRACKSFTPVTTGAVVVEMRVRLDALGSADAVITSLRDRGAESASVRFGQGGTFAYYAGATKVRTEVAFRTGTWYRSTVTVHPDRGTYDWLLASDGGKALVRAERIPFRDPAVKQVGSVCVQTSEGKAGLRLRFDDVVVSH